MNEILDFLKELDANNNREWFAANKSKYDKTKKQFLDITAWIIGEIRKFDPEVPALEPKDCMFRIFRDVRFSNDKRPYKSNYGSYMTKGGRNAGYAGYYLHLAPGEYFVAGGNYMPGPDHLQAIRQEIYYHPEAYKKLIESEPFKSTFDQHYFDALKTAPKGYPKDFEYLDFIRNRSYGFGHKLSEDEVVSGSYPETCIRLFKMIHPVNDFLNRAIDENLHG